MTLSQLIASYETDAAAARALGITERSAKAYRLKERQPRPASAQEIVKKSKGKITLLDCYS
jgi:hypothetical protein